MKRGFPNPNLQLYLFCILVFSSVAIKAQEQINFTKQNSFYINGDATIIGNNSVSKHETKSFNDFSFINDQIKMKYVDIDNDGSTFSSSSASLNIIEKDATIKSAVLYWCAMYPYGNGVKKGSLTEITYKGNGERKQDINAIKFKTPNSDYVDLKGTIVFDGFQSKQHNKSAPYICYADVTSILKENNAFNGEYTVANIRATQGFMTGGSAAGWFLFIIYEAPEASSKYISSYHGFSGINNNAVDINFSDFKTKEKGVSDASIFVATLEGDGKLTKDICSILKPKDSSYLILKNKLRSAKNFFNSKITRDNVYVSDRKPNSTNTLGFDLLQLKLPKGTLLNKQTETQLRLGTKSDRFFLFFAAFKTEISEAFHYNKEAENIIAEVNQPEETLQKEVPEPEEDVEVIDEGPSIAEIKKELKQVRLNIPNIEKGYYLITNVFSKPHYAKKWKSFLTEKSYTPKSFINPKNNWDYVSVYNDLDLRKVYKEYQKLVKHDYFKEIWVFKINMD